jgi:hypothetical protein
LGSCVLGKARVLWVFNAETFTVQAITTMI